MDRSLVSLLCLHVQLVTYISFSWSPPSLKVYQLDSPWIAPVSIIAGSVELVVCLVVVILGKKMLANPVK